MIKNYFKLGFRTLLKNKVPSAINIVGLSISIGIAITTFMFVDLWLNIDKFHENLNEVYYVQTDIILPGGTNRYGTSPAQLRDVLLDEPTVEDVVRVKDADGIIRFEDQVFYDRFRFADPEFLNMFTFPLAFGPENVAFDKSKVILSKKVAERFFDQEIATGKLISITIDGEQREFEVGGVAEKFPDGASFSFGILIHFDNQIDWVDFEQSDWSQLVNATFVQLKKEASTSGISNALKETLPLQNEVSPDRQIEAYHLEPLITASRNSYAINSHILFGNNPAGIYGALFMASLLLALTCINYTNIAVSAATGRLKEIAMRKVIGGRRKELIFQFLIENIIICSLALLAGLLLAYYFLLPGLNSAVPITFPFVLAERFWIFIVLLLFLTSIASGAYPAFYISRFQPIEIFRGREEFGKSLFSKIMLGIQFTIALNLIISAFIFKLTEDYQIQLDWGYAKESKIVLPVENQEQFRKMSDALSSSPDVVQISGAKDHIGKSTQRITIEFESEKYEVRLMETGPGYLDIMGVNLLSGTYFNEDKESDFLESVIINETFMQDLGWSSWEGKIIGYGDEKFNVIGLVQDFHYHSFYTKIYPALFRPVKDDQIRFVVAEIGSGKADVMDEYVRKIWKENLPDLPYSGFFQETVFDYFFQETKANAGLMKFLGFVAIVLSCIGLYGLISFNISKRMKEFSLRKIFGAGGWSIFKQVNRSFVVILIIAILLASPLTYVMMSALIDEIYKYHQEINFTPFALSFLALAITVMFTVSLQLFKVFKSNPIDALRNE